MLVPWVGGCPCSTTTTTTTTTTESPTGSCCVLQSDGTFQCLDGFTSEQCASYGTGQGNIYRAGQDCEEPCPPPTTTTGGPTTTTTATTTTEDPSGRGCCFSEFGEETCLDMHPDMCDALSGRTLAQSCSAYGSSPCDTTTTTTQEPLGRCCYGSIVAPYPNCVSVQQCNCAVTTEFDCLTDYMDEGGTWFAGEDCFDAENEQENACNTPPTTTTGGPTTTTTATTTTEGPCGSAGVPPCGDNCSVTAATCCLPDGSTVIIDCTEGCCCCCPDGTTKQGSSGECLGSDNTTPPPGDSGGGGGSTGSCCHVEDGIGVCSETTEAECDALSGSFESCVSPPCCATRWCSGGGGGGTTTTAGAGGGGGGGGGGGAVGVGGAASDDEDDAVVAEEPPDKVDRNGQQWSKAAHDAVKVDARTAPQFKPQLTSGDVDKNDITSLFYALLPEQWIDDQVKWTNAKLQGHTHE